MTVAAVAPATVSAGGAALSFEELAERCPAGIVVIDGAGAIVYTNPRAQQMLGLEREAYQARGYAAPEWNVTDFAGTPTPAEDLIFSRILRGGCAIDDVEHAVERADGERVYLRISGAPVRDAAGRVARVIFTMVDVSDSVRSERARARSELAIAELIARYEATLAALSEGVTVTDTDGVVRYCNASAERILGLARTDLVGNRSFASRWTVRNETGELLAPELRPVQATLRSGTVRRNFYLHLHDGRDAGPGQWLLVNTQPLRQAPGAPVHAVVASFTDVTALKLAELALRNSEAQFAGALEHAPIGMCLVALDGRFTLVNQAYCRIVGYDKARLEGMTFQSITHPDDLAEDLANVESLVAGRKASYQMDKRYLHCDGQVVWVRLSVSLVRDDCGAPSHFIAQVEDITQRRAAREELARYHADLARSNRDLEQFAYVASHDLQAPLRGIVGFAQLLDRALAARAGAVEHEYLRHIVDSGRQMQRLITDLLAFSRVGRSGGEPVAVDCEALLAEVVAHFHADVGERSAQITHDPLPTVRGVRLELQQLLQNLIGNALKFQPGSGPKVHVAARRDGGFWQFSVQDRGIGIPADAQTRIFGVFARLHPPEDYEGTGIGLSICQKIVEHRGGRIWVDSEPGRGSTFHFTLPCAADNACCHV